MSTLIKATAKLADEIEALLLQLGGGGNDGAGAGAGAGGAGGSGGSLSVTEAGAVARQVDEKVEVMVANSAKLVYV